jgi:hypothetical protein
MLHLFFSLSPSSTFYGSIQREGERGKVERTGRILLLVCWEGSVGGNNATRVEGVGVRRAPLTFTHWLNMAVDLQSLFGLHVT